METKTISITKTIHIDGELHEALRVEAFNKRVSLRELIESILKKKVGLK